ncbi:MAG: hypothetical protein E6G36_06915 [Actinobacteria bacterium]|nr:MAG: hypothetical protein E6G36_06915 [Actinomycetota bacterium]
MLAGLLAVSIPSLGLSKSRPRAAHADQACGRVEFVSGLEAVFGRFKTHQQALTFRSQVTGRGFVNANIIEGCNEFRVVIRGIDTFDIGVDLQGEARREGFAVTLECIQAKPGRSSSAIAAIASPATRSSTTPPQRVSRA